MSHSECPFQPLSTPPKRPKYTAQLQEVPKESWWARLSSNIYEQCSRISPSSLSNGWHVYKTGDVNSLFMKAYKPGQYVTNLRTLLGTQYLTKDPLIMQLVLSQYRNEKDGFFCVPENEKLFQDGIFTDLYPQEMATITDREKEVIAPIIFTAESAHVPSLRARLMAPFKAKAIKEYQDRLDQIAGEILDQFGPDEHASSSSELLAYEYAITVLGRLFTGFNSSREGYQAFVHSLIAISKHLSNLITKQPENAQEQAQYNIALQTMREVIQQNIVNPASSFVAELKADDFTEFTIRLYLFVLYLAGVETTSAVMHYLLLQLGREENRHYQAIIRSEGRESILLKKCVAEALRLNPSVYVMGRSMRKDCLMMVKDETGKVIWSKILRKGKILVNWVAGAARNPQLYPDPDTFNPLRFETIPTQLPWLPFTTGPHTCPGQFLARAEMESLVYEILKRFSIHNIPSDASIESRGTFTLHPDPKGKIQMRLEPLPLEKPHPPSPDLISTQDEQCAEIANATR